MSSGQIPYRNPRGFLAKLLLFAGALITALTVAEVGVRIIDPYPYFDDNEINLTDHGNLSEHDPVLGWRGVPGGAGRMTTKNSSVWLRHNNQGFRDIELDERDPDKPALVFLGDSFTWGYEVEAKQMFVSRVRDQISDRYEVFNLAHRGYGTDQALLTFIRWQTNQSEELQDSRPISAVVLMFSDNDVEDNNSPIRYGKPKPLFVVEENTATLSGVPVPRVKDWERPITWVEPSFRGFGRGLLRSHLIHAVYFQSRLLMGADAKHLQNGVGDAPPRQKLSPTAELLTKLKEEVMSCGAELIVLFIASKREVYRLETQAPYQDVLAELCKKLSIGSYDLAPHFLSTWMRTYYREGWHWNAYGHKIAAGAIYERLQQYGFLL